MGTKLLNKKDIFLIISGIIIAVLLVIVILQNVRINGLKKGLSEAILAEKNRFVMSSKTPEVKYLKGKESGVNVGSLSSEKKGLQENDYDYPEKIKRLESRINDMQEWQDFLEGTLNKQDRKAQERDNIIFNARKTFISSRLEPFAEHTNLSSSILEKLINLRVEEQQDIADLNTENLLPQDRMREIEKIRSHYDEKISQILSEDDYAAYREYQKTENEWGVINQIKKDPVFNDIKLEKYQEEQLVAAMYEDRQAMIPLHKEKVTQNGGYEEQSEEDKLKNSLEYQKPLYERYIESAESILSDAQLQTFKKYFDNQIYMLEKAIASRTERTDE